MSKVFLVAVVLGGCWDWFNKGSVAGTEIQIAEIGEQKLGIEFVVKVKIQIGGETVTTGDIAATAVVVQWKCAGEEYTDTNKIETKTKNGTVEVKITIGEIDDEADKTGCVVKAVAQIGDEEIEFASPPFSVTLHKIELTDNATLGNTLSNTIVAIKHKNQEIKLNETSISLGEGCNGMRLIRWSDDAKVEEVESALADAGDVYMANSWAGLDENCLLQLKNNDGEVVGSALFSLQKTVYSITDVFTEYVSDSDRAREVMFVSLGEGELPERTGVDIKIYAIYDKDRAKNKSVYGTAYDNTIEFGVDEGALPDKFYFKLKEKVLFLLHEPTITDKITARAKEGGIFSIKLLAKGDKVNLEGTTDQVKCAARLYQVSETRVFHPDFQEDVSEERDEDFPGITVAENGNVNDLFVIGNPVNCELRVNGEAIGSFASNPQGSGVEVEVGYESVGEGPSNRYDAITVTTANAPENSSIFVVDGGYSKVNVDPISTDDGKKKYVSGNSAGSYSSTALVRTKPIAGTTWLIRDYKRY